MKSEEFTLLNINDCQLATREDVALIRDKVGPVDLLSTQFSYSGWCGNVEQVEFRKKSALKQLSYVKLQIDGFKPRYVLPFASLVWFCHQESFYLNKEMIQIKDAERMVREDTEASPIVLYPGDAWSPDQEHDPAPALAAYARDYQALDSRDREVSELVEPSRLLAASEKFFATLREKTNPIVTGLWLGREGYYARMYRNQTKRNRLALLFSIVCMRAEPALFWVSDHDQAYELDFRNGLRKSSLPKEQCHVTLSSDSLLFCVTVPWGAETLQVNGRYQENVAEGRHSFAPFFLIARKLYFGNRFDAARIGQKITSRVKGNRAGS